MNKIYEEIEKKVIHVTKQKDWKMSLVEAITCLVVFLLLDSVLFTLILDLLKLIFIIGGLCFLGQAIYLACPIVMEKLEDK